MNAYKKDLSMRAMWIALAGVLAVGIGCTPEQKKPEPPPPAPKIVSFTVTPPQVNAGEKVTLAWTTENATSVELQQVGKGVVSGADALSGSVEVTVQEDALFVLTAKNARGVTESAAVSADVIEAIDEVLFVASPSKVNAGDPVTLAWSATGAKSVSLATKDGESVDLGGAVQSGAVTVLPAVNTTWVLTVDGKSYEASVDVLPTVNAFAATPNAVKGGDMLSLAWKTTGANKVIVSRASEGVIGTETDAAKVADGSLTWQVPASIDPAAAISFTLTAESADGTTSEPSQITVFVTGAPKVRKVTVPALAPEGGTFNVSWETTGADQVQVLQDGVAIYQTPTIGLVDSGSAALKTPSQDAVIQVRALNSRGGEDLSDSFTVSPVGIPTVNSFTASTNHIANGGDLVSLSWDVPSARHLKIVAVNEYTVTEVWGASANQGTLEAYPNKDTEYQLIADNGIGNEVTATTGMVTVATPAHLVFSPAVVPEGAPVQVTGTTVPGSGAMRGLNTVVKNVPGDAFVDISTTGTLLPFSSGDDTVAKMIQLAQPFETEMFGTPVGGSSISVAINGWAFFSPTADGGESVPDTSFPSSDYQPFAVVPWGKDLQAKSDTRVYWADEGTGASRRVIIQWSDVHHYGSSTKILTFEVQLYTDHVVFAYQSLAGVSGSDHPAIGIVKADDDNALVPNAADLTSGLPAAGDTFSFFGPLALPYTFNASSEPLEVSVQVGTGFIRLSDAPGIIPLGQFAITEVNNHPVAGHGEWIELTSNNSAPLDLNGWVIDFGDGTQKTISSSLLLPPNGRLVLGEDTDAAEASAGGAAVDYVYGTGSNLPDGPGTVSLNVAGSPYASLSWGTTRPAGVAYQRGLESTTAMYVDANVTLPCSANVAYGSGTQLGTPGQANTGCYPYAMSVGTPNTFISLATSSTSQAVTNLSGSVDDVAETITLARPVTFFGVQATQLTVDSNGYVSIVPQGDSYYSNDTSPATDDPNGMLAPFWDDLTGHSTAAVRWEQFDPDGTAATGDEYTVIAWEDWYSRHDSSSVLNFEVVFLEGTGDIEFRYGNMTDSDGETAAGVSATTWIEDPWGTSALGYNMDATTPGIAPNSTLHFTAQ